VLGGEPLAGSGFETEAPSRGFQPNGAADESISSQQATPPSETANSSVPSSDTSGNGGNGTPRRRIPKIRRRFPALPSDAAPHATPPRMPIDHEE
jgi:hypothetical protein